MCSSPAQPALLSCTQPRAAKLAEIVKKIVVFPQNRIIVPFWYFSSCSLSVDCCWEIFYIAGRCCVGSHVCVSVYACRFWMCIGVNGLLHNFFPPLVLCEFGFAFLCSLQQTISASNPPLFHFSSRSRTDSGWKISARLRSGIFFSLSWKTFFFCNFMTVIFFLHSFHLAPSHVGFIIPRGSAFMRLDCGGQPAAD